MTTTYHKPVTEIHMSKTGALLSTGDARYPTMSQYVEMFAAPLSQIGGRLWTFADPLIPELVLLVQCEEGDYCERCQRDLERCSCPF